MSIGSQSNSGPSWSRSTSSQATVYVSNLPFSLTNSDLYKVFEKFGKVVKVTLMKDRQTRRSKGVAFVLFLERNEALKCVDAINGSMLFDRTLKASIAKDNGRSTEFDRRREYPDKSRCYECGEFGHLSLKCPRNQLGERVKIRKKPPKSGFKFQNSGFARPSRKHQKVQKKVQPSRSLCDHTESESDDEITQEQPFAKTISSASCVSSAGSTKKLKYRKSEYFSDEDEIVED